MICTRGLGEFRSEHVEDVEFAGALITGVGNEETRGWELGVDISDSSVSVYFILVGFCRKINLNSTLNTTVNAG